MKQDDFAAAFFGLFLLGVGLVLLFPANPALALDARILGAAAFLALGVHALLGVGAVRRSGPGLAVGDVDERGRLVIWSRSEGFWVVNLAALVVGPILLVLTFPPGTPLTQGRIVIAALLGGLGTLAGAAVLVERRSRRQKAIQDTRERLGL